MATSARKRLTARFAGNSAPRNERKLLTGTEITFRARRLSHAPSSVGLFLAVPILAVPANSARVTGKPKVIHRAENALTTPIFRNPTCSGFGYRRSYWSALADDFSSGSADANGWQR